MQKIALVIACVACAAQGNPVDSSNAIAKLLMSQNQLAAFNPSFARARHAAGGRKASASHAPMKKVSAELDKRMLAQATAMAAALSTSLPALAGPSQTFDVNPIVFALFMLYPFVVAIIKDIISTKKDDPLLLTRQDLDEIGKIIGSKYQ